MISKKSNESFFCLGQDAISMNSQLHDQRRRTNGIRSPETKSNRALVSIDLMIEDFILFSSIRTNSSYS